MTMGGSEKADDDTKIGHFSSGLKMSMAIAHRNNVELSVKVYDTDYSDSYDRKRETLYSVGTFIQDCKQTGKNKELLQIYKNVKSENFHSGNCSDYGGGEYPEEIIQTGFSTKLGIDWKLWMLLREVYSNMIDEGGEYSETPFGKMSYGSVVELSFEDDCEFSDIWDNRHLYINEKAPLFKLSNSVDVLENEEGYLRLYKQNILVYKDEKRPSKYAYNIHFGTIDERRILSDVYSVESQIISAIQYTENEEYLRTIITSDFSTQKGEFLSNMSVYGTSNELIHKIASEVYEEFGEVKSYDWLLDTVKKRKDCRIGGKKIRTISDAIFAYSDTVTVETTPNSFSTPETIETESDGMLTDPFINDIKKYYNFKLDVEVKKAKLKGSKVIADKFANCLIIDDNFDLQNDFHEFIIQYIDLTQKDGNVVTNLGKYICKILKV
jgi:hypothetical protein